MPIVPDPNMLGPDYCLFCDTVYDKAGSVISTVRNAFGKDAAFIDGLSQYLQAWSFKNPSDTSLWTALDNVRLFRKSKFIFCSQNNCDFDFFWRQNSLFCKKFGFKILKLKYKQFFYHNFDFQNFIN